MTEDTVDSALYCKAFDKKKVPSIEALNSEMPGKLQKDRGKMIFKTFLNRLRLKKYASATISKPDPTYKVAYLGNVITGWAKGDGCVEKPLATLWRNYTHSSRPDVRMILTVSGGGLKATTKDHGLTEYWAHRLTTCSAPAQFPRLFCWVYRHEGRRLKHELRCHAVLCSTAAQAKQIEAELKESLALALLEFKKDKISRQNARLSLVNSVYENPTIPRRKIMLSTGQTNYRPPLERSKSAPKLTSIEELIEEEEDTPKKPRNPNRKLKHYDSASAILDKRKSILDAYSSRPHICVPVTECCDEPAVKPRETKVTFNDDIVNISLDEKSDMILEELVQSSLSNDFLESCERAWITALGETPDCIPVDSDEGSLSSGCESASTVNSDVEQPVFSVKQEITEETVVDPKPENKKTELDFKVGGSVLARVRSFERIANSDILKYCGLNTNIYSNKSLLGREEVSLIPVGESQTDFSSLKVFKKKIAPERDVTSFNVDEIDGNGSEEENGSACSDESGYEEEEIVSSVSNIVLV